MKNVDLVTLKPAFLSIISLLFALIAGGVILLVIGQDPIRYFSLLFARGLGSPLGFVEAIIQMAPLLIVAAGLLPCFSGGLWNIGVEGQFLIGALLTGWAAPMLSSVLPYPVYLLAALMLGTAGGIAWISIPAVLKAKSDINEIITTLMMTWVAINLVAWLVKGPLNDPSTVPAQTTLIPLINRMPHIPFSRIHIGLIIGLISLMSMHWLVKRTVLGYQFRVMSANLKAARHAGMRIPRLTIYALLISGGFAGLAGACDVLAIKGLFQASWNPQYGMTAIPLIFLARLNGWAVIPLALFFSLLGVGGEFVARDLGVPAFFVHVLEGLTLLSFAASEYFSKSSNFNSSPSADPV